MMQQQEGQLAQLMRAQDSKMTVIEGELKKLSSLMSPKVASVTVAPTASAPLISTSKPSSPAQILFGPGLALCCRSALPSCPKCQMRRNGRRQDVEREVAP